MFLGHFALGVALKPKAPQLPVWSLLLAPQALDLLFLPLVAVGVESYQQGSFGQDTIQAYYSHSLVGALLISAVVFWLGKKFGKSSYNGWVLGLLSFSHWPIDLLVHHRDLTLLPGNMGDLPMLGFGLWDYTYVIFGLEVFLALLAVIVYFRWAMKHRTKKRWFLGPVIVTMLFLLIIAGDIPRLGPM